MMILIMAQGIINLDLYASGLHSLVCSSVCPLLVPNLGTKGSTKAKIDGKVARDTSN